VKHVKDAVKTRVASFAAEITAARNVLVTRIYQLSFAFTDLQGDAILFDFAIDLRASAGETPGEDCLWVGGTAAPPLPHGCTVAPPLADPTHPHHGVGM